MEVEACKAIPWSPGSRCLLSDSFRPDILWRIVSQHLQDMYVSIIGHLSAYLHVP